jgi:hypothetical protein
MKYYYLKLRQRATGYIRFRRVYWSKEQYDHYSNRLNEPIAGIEILSIEEHEPTENI